MTPPLSPLELTIFSLALVGSIGLFVRNIRPVATAVLRSKPEPGYRIDNIPQRLRRFVLEVLLQAKVIRHRPWVGFAHALVFWGFLAFALITVDHLLRAVGVSFLGEAPGTLGASYSLLAAVFAGGVIAGITALAVRRFVARPKWLGDKVSYESGFIAFLIVLLMATHIAASSARLSGATGENHVIWWLHTFALLSFLPLIPLTKHLHLLLSPFTVFVMRSGFSRIPPLEGDEDFGLDTGKDITQIAALQAFSCVECGRCMEHCPANNTGKTLNPKEIALGFRSYLRENGPQGEPALLGRHLSEEAIFQCTTCGACETQCPVGVQHLPLIIGLRRGAVNTGKWEDEYGGELFNRLERNGNPLGMSQLERDRFVQRAALPLYNGSQEYLLWLGCMGAFDPQGRQIVESLARVLSSMGVTFGVLKKEKCSGDAARRLGNDLAFQQLAEFNLEQINAVRAKKIVSICPHCVRTLGEDYGELGAKLDIRHHSELLAEHEDELPRDSAGGKIVFHDPCYLGRYRGVYDAPRQVAGRFGHELEAKRSRETSFCCGAGGGLTFLGEEKGKRVSHERAEELMATGAETVAVACPFCNSMFRDAFSAIRPEGAPKLLDIVQIADAALARSAGPATAAPPSFGE